MKRGCLCRAFDDRLTTSPENIVDAQTAGIDEHHVYRNQNRKTREYMRHQVLDVYGTHVAAPTDLHGLA